MIGWILLTPVNAPAITHRLLLLCGILVGFLIFLGVQAKRWKAAVERARRCGGRVCPSCLYELGTVVEGVATCPECGLQFTADELQSAWSAELGP